ncbi:hypothetical protein SERLA73DRAFT_79998 [Serpula lacrymans var. lacrymans S7.3]|uniref:Uncharacterized protein n=2 Tax=Serpula lacrymans var. lacrymans TaxID=341189 RepID=F8QIB0_SERL3|nr:uncharacterized protein SERLADRAFT_431909 [Serpula lacrymans var. lacrymans S7.9]EGN91963.1 hypothetical protein SERLA73DRAFT_79998 [Serpula lacrymans var. lacrymans S7.3]EGO30375.1 hypothetical protein SERLADRAFT_431909 [Serpula lacrymans var. lacrymans S7.9]
MSSNPGKCRCHSSTPLVEETSSSDNSSKPSLINNAAATVLTQSAKGPGDLKQHWLALYGDTESANRKKKSAEFLPTPSHLLTPSTPPPAIPPSPGIVSPQLRYGSTSTYSSDGVLLYLNGGGFGQGCPVDRKGRYKYNKLERYKDVHSSPPTPPNFQEHTIHSDNEPCNTSGKVMDENKENCTDSIIETIGKDGKDSDTAVIPTGNLTQKCRLDKRDNNISNINEQILESVCPSTPTSHYKSR